MSKSFEGLITLTKVSASEPGDSPGLAYYIETNTREISRHRDGTVQQEEPTYRLEPENLVFKILDGVGTLLTDRKTIKFFVKLQDSDNLQETENFELTFEEGIYSLNLKELLKLFITVDSTTSTVDQVIANTIFLKLQTEIEGHKYEAILGFQNGVTDTLATFALKADGFVSAWRNNKLEFNGDGLTVSNGGLKIKNVADEIVFDADEWGNLRVTGTINANEGSIGKIEIRDGALRGEKDCFIIDENGITANNLFIGTGASIGDYIKVGNGFLYNPVKHDGNFLRSGEIFLTDYNELKVGSIKMFGGDNNKVSSISATNNKDASWEITGDGIARFKKIYADDVHLQNTILEQSTIQLVGGSMVFKDSCTVSSVNKIEDGSVTKYKIVLDHYGGLSQGDYFIAKDKLYQIQETSESEGYYIVNEEITAGALITKLGQPSTSESQGDFIIAIAGEKNIAQNYARGNSLTMSEFEIKEGEIRYTQRLILGDLGEDGIGLYADNVKLNGSLTTQVGADSYAGVNTLTGVTATIFKPRDEVADNSKIVFWAGSKSAETKDIQSAPFQVTEKGSIYASKADLTDSLFVGGTIEAAEIKGSRIYGTDIYGTNIYTANIYGSQDNAALNIYDANKGISFKAIIDGGEKEVFSIGSTGIKSEEKSIIEISNGQAIYYVGNGLIEYNNEDSALNLTANSVKLNGTVKFDQQMEYKKVDGGYDLYVKAAKELSKW